MRAHDAVALAEAIAGSCEIKASIVARDEREAGERALLNLGHTFGHAIEAMTGYSRWLHGEAVGCGLVLAAELSCLLGMLKASDVQIIETAVIVAPVCRRGSTACRHSPPLKRCVATRKPKPARYASSFSIESAAQRNALFHNHCCCRR